MRVHTRRRETLGPLWRLAAIVSLSVTYVHVPLIWEVRSQQVGRTKFPTAAGGCTLEQEMLPTLGEALRKVTKM